jgi:hypothetical protein
MGQGFTGGASGSQRYNADSKAKRFPGRLDAPALTGGRGALTGRLSLWIDFAGEWKSSGWGDTCENQKRRLAAGATGTTRGDEKMKIPCCGAD